MQNRIVEILSDGAHLSLSRGFVSIQIDEEIAGQVAIEDMAALITRGYGASISLNVCSRLAEANVPVVLCCNNGVADSIRADLQAIKAAYGRIMILQR